MKTKIQIKSIFGNLLFEYESENNSIKKALIEALKQNADLRNADLRSANLRNADLRNADLRSADLWNADLRNADLRSADLRNADLWSADLRSADLRNADLRNVNLRSANLRNANLWNADLWNADLRNANFNKKQIKELKPFFQIIPEQGSFIAWKKGANNHLIKIEIPERAKRICSFVGRKCRAEFIKVLEIWDGRKKVRECCGYWNKNFRYKIGELIYPDSFNDNPLIECSHGIHFFITKQEAKDF